MSRNRFPFGIPAGWYVVATSQEVEPGQVVCRRYFDRELAVYRTQGGEVSVIDAYCPHMGAHLGKLGKVEGETLRCGFHGFRYGLDGHCVATEYDSPPPEGARLRRWEHREFYGLILVWFHPLDDPPDWEVPVIDRQGWSDIRIKHYQIATHPQETTENSVDFGHFTRLHGFVDGAVTRPIRIDGPFLDTSYSAFRSYPGFRLRVAYDVKVAGLGYSQVEISIPQLHLQLRAWVLPVPVDGEHIELRLGLSAVQTPGLTMLLRRIGHAILCKEIDQDLDVWEHKAYLESPELAKGDGPIGAYRRWASQFYSVSNSSSDFGAS